MYLVVGANGFLGSYILKNIIEKTDDDIIAVARNIQTVTENLRIQWLSHDISQTSEIDRLCHRIKEIKDIKVIFLAAYHNPDLVEKNPQEAWNMNVTMLSYFVNSLESIKCFFYPSTDSVYGSSNNGYHFKETDTLQPVNIYGKQKCAAESIVLWRGYNVVRYPFLIAPSLSPVKKHFYDQIVEKICNGEKMEMFADSYRSSLNFDTAASLLIQIIENYSSETPKILNICSDDDLSKYEIGNMIADKFGISREFIVPINMTSSNEYFKADRAQSTLMDNSELKKLLGLEYIKFVL